MALGRSGMCLNEVQFPKKLRQKGLIATEDKDLPQ